MSDRARSLVDTEAAYRELVTRAGGIFAGLRDDSVLFRSNPEGRTLSLYLFACRTVSDVELALKAEREQMNPPPMWERAGAAAVR